MPLPPGSGVGAYESAMDRIVIPALRRFRPGLIIVASGYDGGLLDPMGRMMLHSEAFRGMTRTVLALADELCGGRLVICHEGGYSSSHVPFCGLAVLEALSGRRTDCVDPFLGYAQHFGQQELQPHQDALIASVEPLLERVPQPR